MAKKTFKNSWGWSSESRLEQSMALSIPAAEAKRTAEIHVHLGKTASLPKSWQAEFPNSEAAVRVVDHAGGVKMLLSPRVAVDPETDPRLKASLGTQIRDLVGASLGQLEKLGVSHAVYNFDLPSENLAPAILGLEIALYRFKRCRMGEKGKIKLTLLHKGRALSLKNLAEPLRLGQAVNLARHLVNLPPNELNPQSYADFAAALLGDTKNTRVEIWDESRLQRENMNLHVAVGQASSTPARLVHIRYRGGAKKMRPLAFVGKGVTFDSGGLDIKPSSGMRLMKKDMGGSAAVLALAFAVANIGWKGNADFYLALAENAIGGNSFRPGDLIQARNGLRVEIHNTDAEGRLVLADAMDVAVTAEDKPSQLIDVATLTGAIKVALGAGVAGLFANGAKLAASLTAAAQAVGDPVWEMPLVQKYRSQLNSPFADMVNSSDGFGGAITAALFLEKFTRGVPWAHLDIYAWKDAAEGAWLESGGSGQAVLALCEWLKKRRV